MQAPSDAPILQSEYRRAVRLDISTVKLPNTARSRHGIYYTKAAQGPLYLSPQDQHHPYRAASSALSDVLGIDERQLAASFTLQTAGEVLTAPSIAPTHTLSPLFGWSSRRKPAVARTCSRHSGDPNPVDLRLATDASRAFLRITTQPGALINSREVILCREREVHIA